MYSASRKPTPGFASKSLREKDAQYCFRDHSGRERARTPRSTRKLSSAKLPKTASPAAGATAAKSLADECFGTRRSRCLQAVSCQKARLRAVVILFAREIGGLGREQLEGVGAGFFFFATEMEMPFPDRRRDELNGSEGGRNSLEGPRGDMFHENLIGFHLLQATRKGDGVDLTIASR
jgi:hypothetical protein